MTTAPAFAPRERAPRLDEAFERARLTLVPRRRVRAARMPFVALVSLVLLGGVVGLLCFNTQMQQASFAETTLEAQDSTLSAREQTLHDEVQSLRDPQHLAVAAQHAGMVIPQSACTLKLGSGVTDAACTPAAPGNTPPLYGKAPAKPASINPQPDVVVVQAPPVTPPATTGRGQGQGKGQGKHHHHGAKARTSD